MKARKIAFTLVGLLILLSSNIKIVKAVSFHNDLKAHHEYVKPSWFSGSKANVSLSGSTGFIDCKGIVEGKYGTSKISAIMTLEERDGWSWRRVDHWSKISYSDFLSMSGSYRAVSGRTYRLTINADVTVNGVVERVSNSTETRF